MKWVRPTISIIGLLGVTYLAVVGKILPESYLLLVGVTITFWFKSRDEEKKRGA